MDADRRQELESQLSAYIDGELTDEERAEVEAFLAHDARARHLLAELRATVAGLQAQPRAKASGDLMAGVRSRLERRALLGSDQPTSAMPSATSSFGSRWVAAAAVIALAVVAGVVMWSFTDQEPHRSRDQFAMHKPAEVPPRAARGRRREELKQASPEDSGFAEKKRALTEGGIAGGVLTATPPPTKRLAGLGEEGEKGRPIMLSKERVKVIELGIATAPASGARVVARKEPSVLRTQWQVTTQPQQARSELGYYLANRPVKLGEEYAAQALMDDYEQSPATQPATIPCRAASLQPLSTRPAAATRPAPLTKPATKTQPAATSLPAR